MRHTRFRRKEVSRMKGEKNEKKDGSAFSFHRFCVVVLVITIALNVARTTPTLHINTLENGGTPSERISYGFDDESGSGVAIFYNLFVPSDDEGVANALNVVKEQIRQLGQSTLIRENASNITMKMYYNLIGNKDGIPHETMQSLCANVGLQCHLQRTFVEGTYEEVTLDMLHDYCVSHQDHRAIYFHSKGSFHDTQKNRIWRRNMLEAITSPQCVNPPDPSCSLCGLLFFPLWQMIVPGNFFVADCRYVSKLPSPIDYKEHLASLVRMRRQHGFSSHIYNPGCYNLGMERFASELWIGSHPDLIPCDLATVVDVEYWKRVPWDVAANYSSFGLAPRFPITHPDWQNLKHERLAKVLKDPNARLREHYLLAGVLYRHSEIYEQLPHPSSWIWEWFPDGEDWKDILFENGAEVQDPSAAIRQVLSDTPKGLRWWIFDRNGGMRCKSHE